MKIRILFLSLLAIMFSATTLMAGQTDDFKFDRQQVQDEFADLSRLEQTVVQNDFMSLFELRTNNMLSVEFANMSLSPMMSDAALGIPGFWWGCVFGPIGILIVYLVTDNDRDQVKKSLTGCIVGSAVQVGFYLIYYLVILDSAL